MKHQHLSQHRQSSVTLALAIVVISVLLLTGSSPAQDIYAYPAKGQGQAQQDRDRYECHSWAVQQTGFDPSRSQAVAPDTPSASNQPLPPQGDVVRGAARGAALGAVGRKGASLMLEKTIKRRLEDTRNAAPASDDGPIFSTVASWSSRSSAPFRREREARSERK